MMDLVATRLGQWLGAIDGIAIIYASFQGWRLIIWSNDFEYSR